MLVLLVCIEAYSVTQGMIIPAVPSLARGFGIDVTTASWVLSANLAVTGVAVPLLGRLGDMYGRRPLMLVTLGLYGLGSLVAALGPGFAWVVTGRALAGLGGGVFGLTYALAREWLPAQQRTRAVSILSVSVSFGAMIGMPLGGWVLDLGGYSAVLWCNVLSAAISLTVAALMIPRHGMRTPASFDVPGLVGLTLVVMLPLLALAWITKQGHVSPGSAAVILVAAVIAVVFVKVELRARAPMVDVRLARSKQVLIANTVSFLVGVGNFAVMVQIPIIAQSVGAGLGLDALSSGLLLLPGSLMQIPVAFLVGRVSTRLGNRVTLAIGSGLSAAGFVCLAVAHTSAPAIIVGVIVVFSGIGFCFAASVNVVVQNVPSAQTGEATGVNALVRVVGSAFAAPVIISIMSVGSLQSPAGKTVLISSSVADAFIALAVVMIAAGALTLALRRSGASAREQAA